MAEPIYKELEKHLQSKTRNMMGTHFPSLLLIRIYCRFLPFNVTYGSEARKIADRYTFTIQIERRPLLVGCKLEECPTNFSLSLQLA